MAMAVSMAAMMAPSAAPFFVAYGRDSRRPVAIAAVVLIYVAAWAAIGFGLDYAMGQLMMPSLSWEIAAAAIGVAVVYAVTPWSRWARARCRAMCGREPRGNPLVDAARYTACCAVCSAGIMAALVVIGMTNVLVLIAAAGAMVVYKLI
jgi:hypothetical protein